MRPGSVPARSRVIVVVRDAARAEAIARAVTRRARSNAEVRVVRTRREATEWARKADGHPLIVLAELHLAVPNAGLELLHHLATAVGDVRAFLLAPAGRFLDGGRWFERLDETLSADEIASKLHPAHDVVVVEEANPAPGLVLAQDIAPRRVHRAGGQN